MIAMHWVLEYVAVFCGYVFLLFIWPSVVFHKHLANKSKVYWLGFCVTGQVVLINTIVLLFGLAHILNRWTIIVFFYGVFLLALLRSVKISRETIESIRYLFKGMYGKKRLFFQMGRFLWDKLKQLCVKIWTNIYPHLGEYVVLAVLLVFGMVYFSYGAFQDYSYGFGDIYTHHNWIYGLIEGKIFSAGVYPEAMHCFVYCLHTIFGIKVYSILLFLAGIHIAVLLIFVYFFLKEIFYWRYTPFFVLMLFLTVDVVCVDEVFSMSRLQWTLPQEFGLYALFACALFLTRYLKYAKETSYKGKRLRFYWDENLFLFALAIAASVAIHFYVVIMAVLLCASIALFALKKVLSYKRFVPLVAAALCAVFVAAAPMAGALACGIHFQGSIDWAVNVMQGTNTEEGRFQADERPQAGQPEDEKANVVQSGMNWCKEKITGVYKEGYRALYQTERARWIVACTILAAVLWIAFRLSAILLRKRFQKRINAGCFDGYPGVIFASFFFMFIYAAPLMGLPELIAGSRLCSTEQILILAVIVMPLDMLFSLLARSCKPCRTHGWILQAASILCTAGIYVAAILLGAYHGYLYYELTRYNAAVMVTESIVETFPQESYTIVSPIDEVYPVIEYGHHEELLDFVEKSDDNGYALSTEYVFIYIEKKPLAYSQYHFFTGNSWLAAEKYSKFFLADADNVVSRCPEIRGARISEDAAQRALTYDDLGDAYRIIENRVILESKAYEWCKRFGELYPLELNTYYEDDSFVCYYFIQEPHVLYNLAIE